MSPEYVILWACGVAFVGMLTTEWVGSRFGARWAVLCVAMNMAWFLPVCVWCALRM